MVHSWQALELTLVLNEFTGHTSHALLLELIKEPAGQTVRKVALYNICEFLIITGLVLRNLIEIQ